MTAAVQVRSLRFRYPGASSDSLRGVDLTLDRGDFVAVVGGNGSGKTTLCKTFNGLVPHYWAGEFEGEVRVMGQDTTASSVAALSHLVGYVYQDFGNQLVRPTVRDEVSFGPVNFGMSDHAERTDEVLELLGLSPLADEFVWQLSGGQQHLAALASVLSMRPQVIVVDEPVAELDPARAHDIYACLTRVNELLGTTIVVIEHHAEFVARYCRSVVLMADGAPVWHLPVQAALGQTDELVRHGIPAPQMVEVARHFDPTGPVPLDVEATARLVESRLEATPAPVPRPEPAGRRPPAGVAAPVATLEAVRYGYRGVKGAVSDVLNGVDLTLRAGERIAVVGSNGAGKSTLMRLLCGLKVPRSGTVRVLGHDTRSMSPGHLADHVSYLYQRPEHMFLQDTVRADIAMFPSERGRPDVDQLVDGVLDRVRLRDLAERDGRSLSGGQQRRATLGIGLAMRPALLLLDEPTASLDIGSRDGVIAMLDDLSETIRCVVIATHDMHLVAEWADRVIVLGAGRVLADTTPSGLIEDPELLARARLVAPQVVELGLRLGLRPLPCTVAELLTSLHHAAARSARTIVTATP